MTIYFYSRHLPVPYEILLHILSFLVPPLAARGDKTTHGPVHENNSPRYPGFALITCLSVNKDFRRAASALLKARILHLDPSPATVRWAAKCVEPFFETTFSHLAEPKSRDIPDFNFDQLGRSLKHLRTFHSLQLERSLAAALRRRAAQEGTELGIEVSTAMAGLTLPVFLRFCSQLDTIVLTSSSVTYDTRTTQFHNFMDPVSNFGSTLRTLHVHHPYTSCITLLAKLGKVNRLEEVVIDHCDSPMDGLDAAVAALLRCQVIRETVDGGNRKKAIRGGGGRLRKFLLKGVYFQRNQGNIDFLTALTECRASDPDDPTSQKASLASNLRQIHLPDMALTPSVVQRLAQCTNLDALSIDYFARVYDQEFPTGTTGDPNRFLNGHLHPGRTAQPEERAIRMLPVFHALGRNLQYLSMRCETSECLKHIAMHTPNLKSLSLMLPTWIAQWENHYYREIQPFPTWTELARNCGSNLRTLRLFLIADNLEPYVVKGETDIHILRAVGPLFTVLENLLVHGLQNTEEVFTSIYTRRKFSTPLPFPNVKRVYLPDSHFRHIGVEHTLAKSRVKRLCPQVEFEDFTEDESLWDERYFS